MYTAGDKKFIYQRHISIILKKAFPDQMDKLAYKTV